MIRLTALENMSNFPEIISPSDFLVVHLTGKVSKTDLKHEEVLGGHLTSDHNITIIKPQTTLEWSGEKTHCWKIQQRK